MRLRLGNRESIRIREDRWMPQPYNFKVQSSHHELPVWVKHLIDLVTKNWRRDDVIWWFTEDEAKLILNMPISRRGYPNKLL